MKKISLITTADGSHSLHLDEIGEGYHSVQGAVAEAQHVYINPNLAIQSQTTKELNVLEMGFGTGLNALLTLLYAEEHNFIIHYHTIEAYPLNENIYTQLNYPTTCTKNPNATEWFLKIHQSPWNTPIEITPHFVLNKQLGDAQETIKNLTFPFHCCYYDAFAPQYQPELWSEAIFSQLYAIAQPGAIVSTYCCKGDVKRALKFAGFKIEKLPGFANKREMLRATKI